MLIFLAWNTHSGSLLAIVSAVEQAPINGVLCPKPWMGPLYERGHMFGKLYVLIYFL